MKMRAMEGNERESFNSRRSDYSADSLESRPAVFGPHIWKRKSQNSSSKINDVVAFNVEGKANEMLVQKEIIFHCFLIIRHLFDRNLIRFAHLCSSPATVPAKQLATRMQNIISGDKY